MTQQYNNTQQLNMEFPIELWTTIKEYMIPTVPTRHRQMMKRTLETIGRFQDWYQELLEYHTMGVMFWSSQGRDLLEDHRNGRYPDLLEGVMDLMTSETEDRISDMSTLMTTLDLDDDDDKSLCNKLLNLYPHQPEMMELFNDNHGVIQKRINVEFKKLLLVYKRLFVSQIMCRELKIARDDTQLYDELSIIMPIRRDCPPIWYQYERMCNNMI